MFTILGATGFIGSRLAAALAASGEECRTPTRRENLAAGPAASPAAGRTDGRSLGHVIDCVGVNDFMERPEAAIEAHAGRLVALLGQARFESYLYLSSTRVYLGAASTREDAAPPVDTGEAWAVFNLTKLLGEALCLADPRPEVRVVRLSNVYGEGQIFEPVFLPTLIRDALAETRVRLSLSPASAKDYVSVEDVAALLPRIASGGRRRLYNVAAGENVANADLVAALTRETGCRVEIAEDAPDAIFPPIDIGRVREEFDFAPSSLLDDLPGLVASARKRLRLAAKG